MRKPRDFDSELKALSERSKELRERKLLQLGDLVTSTGADVLAVEVLAGALLAVAATNDGATVEGWREQGAAFFRSKSRSVARRNRGNARGDPANDGSAKSLACNTSET